MNYFLCLSYAATVYRSSNALVTSSLSLSTPYASFATMFAGKRDDDRSEMTNMSDELWGKPTPKGDTGEDMSQALPFVPRPKLLDGTLPGDAGFDPFGFAGTDKERLIFMREAEVKHGRLAMLAVVGWPLAELFDKSLANVIDKPDLLTRTGQSPTVLNGGLDKIQPEYWILCVALAGLVELSAKERQEQEKINYIPGDCGFDPFNFFPKEKAGQMSMQTKEIKHGRLAMMAILGFVVQEVLYNTPVVSQTPFFFHPIF